MIIGFDDEAVSEFAEQNSFTALLVGTDYQPEVTKDAPTRADTIILVRFSYETNTVVYMNIPAITQITVDGADSTLSKAYTDKDISYLKEKIQGMTGLHINYHAIVSLEDFSELVESLEDIVCTAPISMNYEDESQELVIDLVKGQKLETGDDISKMLRYCSDSYENRMLRNGQFVKTVIEQFTKAEQRSKAGTLLVTALPNIVTDFDEDDLIKYMDTIFNYSSYKVVDLDFKGEFKTSGKDTYFVPEPEETIKMLAEYKNY
ncbi:MAG: LCP family protein [Clostridia bacterium]|nr:LCP family protein [Clostridia bacterium]